MKDPFPACSEGTRFQTPAGSLDFNFSIRTQCPQHWNCDRGHWDPAWGPSVTNKISTIEGHPPPLRIGISCLRNLPNTWPCPLSAPRGAPEPQVPALGAGSCGGLQSPRAPRFRASLRTLAHREGSWIIVVTQLQSPPERFCVPEDGEGTLGG